MEAAERTIAQIFAGQIRYEIPNYQRPYSWEATQVGQLLEDVWEAYEARDPEYFIGSLITIEHEKGARYEVVDGQQRLTTLNLVFARLRDAMTEPAKSELGRLVLPSNALTGETEAPRLRVRQRDQAFFRKYMLEAKEVDAQVRGKIDRDQDAPKQRFLENLKTIDAFIGAHTEDQLKLFANYLLQKVHVVFVTTSSLASAYRLFNVLNTRGMPLSNADIIKNQIFSKFASTSETDDNISDEIHERWLELEGLVSVAGMDQFLGHHRMALTGVKARKILHEEFASIIKTVERHEPFLEGLLASAGNYLRIGRKDFHLVETARAARAMSRSTFDDWAPALLAFLNQPLPDMPEVEFVRLLEKLTYQFWIRRIGFNHRFTAYAHVIAAIRDGKSAEELRAVFRRHADDEDMQVELNGDLYRRTFAQAVLLRLEEAAQDASVTKSFGEDLSIEHVLPQSPKAAYWNERFTEDQYVFWRHRLGNLTLLSGNKNKSSQNFDFERKKKIYKERNARVSFDLTKAVLDLPDWTPEVLETRQKELVERAMRLWRLSPAA